MNIYDNSWKATTFRRTNMKKLLVIAAIAVVAIVVALSGCAAGKTYAYDMSESGYCQEVTTNDKDAQNALLSAGYTEGAACPRDNLIGTCTYSDRVGTQSVTTVQYFYSGSYFDATTAQSYCEDYNGNWEAQ
jgi:hypothetical protein